MSFISRCRDTRQGMERWAGNGDGGDGREAVSAPPPDRYASTDQDADLAEVLADFRLSVHAWSEAAYAGPRSLKANAAGRTPWRKAGAWALGCAVAAAAAGGGIYEHHHGVELARIAATRAAEQQRQAAEQRAREAEDLLARVDSDVSREVPNALEPLAQLMDDQNQ